MFKLTPPTIKFIFDRGENARFTNGDVIKGKVQLTTKQQISVSAIQLELKGFQMIYIKEIGYFKTLIGSTTHELLYDCYTIFSATNNRNKTKSKLSPGVHEYPFSFKLPVNAHCGDPESIKLSKIYNSTKEEMMITQSSDRVEKYQKLKNQVEPDEETKEVLSKYHKVAPLPPPCSGERERESGSCKFDISYFLKATIIRSGLRFSMRKEINLDFVPIENDEEIEKYKEKEEEGEDSISDTVTIHKSVSEEFLSVNRNLRYNTFVAIKPYNFSTERPWMTPLYKIPHLELQFDVEFKLATRLIRNNEIPKIEKLALLTKFEPNLFQYENAEKNGEGIIYVREIHISLIRHSELSVFGLKTDNKKTYNLFDFESDGTMLNFGHAHLSFDHENIYELELPEGILNNLELPKNEPPLVPSFETCCVRTWYTFELIMKFTGKRAVSPIIKEMTLEPEVLVLGGIRTPVELDSEGTIGRPPAYDVNEIGALPPPYTAN